MLPGSFALYPWRLGCSWESPPCELTACARTSLQDSCYCTSGVAQCPATGLMRLQAFTQRYCCSCEVACPLASRSSWQAVRADHDASQPEPEAGRVV